MVEVKVLIEGKHAMVDGEMSIGSTVTLIKTDKNIIVDTGGFGNDENKLIDSLKTNGLTPENIDIIILTHLHIDHTSNTHLFKNAKVYLKFHPEYPGQFHEIGKGILKRFEINDGTEIAKDVSILLTPGHTWDMISVLINTDDGNIVVAGDAMPKEEFIDLDKKADPSLVYDVKQFDESRSKILNVADYIIPGHGKMFKVNR